jgi:hypothetical protein
MLSVFKVNLQTTYEDENRHTKPTQPPPPSQSILLHRINPPLPSVAYSGV